VFVVARDGREVLWATPWLGLAAALGTVLAALGTVLATALGTVLGAGLGTVLASGAAEEAATLAFGGAATTKNAWAVQTAATEERFIFHNIPDPYAVKDLIMELQKKFEKQEDVQFSEMISKKIHHDDDV